jgi:hypothetical protein
MSNNLEDLKPALKTMLRAFGVGWSTTTAPALLTLLVKTIVSKKPGAIQRALTHTLPMILKKSVTQNGFPFLLAGAFGGHQFIQKLFDQAKQGVSQKRALFISAALSMFAVRRAFPNIKTLDLTFFVLVRAFDVLAHKMCASERIREKVPSGVLEYGNVLVFMMACTEIMFSWFFEPERLPK